MQQPLVQACGKDQLCKMYATARMCATLFQGQAWTRGFPGLDGPCQ